VGATVGGNPVTSVAIGQSVNLVATVNTNTPVVTAPGSTSPSNGAGPTGTVIFSACGTAGSCTVTVTPVNYTTVNTGAYAIATLPTTFTTAGTQNIAATFTTGDGNYFSCTTAISTATQLCTLTALSLNVTAAATKLAFAVQPTSALVNATIAPPVQLAP
jgi:hypothetical protein